MPTKNPPSLGFVANRKPTNRPYLTNRKREEMMEMRNNTTTAAPAAAAAAAVTEVSTLCNR